MKLIYISAFSRAVILVTGGLLATTESAIAGTGFCGPQNSQGIRAFLPDYICFEKSGAPYHYKTCALTHPTSEMVYFGAACSGHDDCYEIKTKKKSSCDKEFKDKLVAICQNVINRSWSKAIQSCISYANEAYDLVVHRPEACEAYKTAQQNLGVEEPTCDLDGQSQSQLGVRERIEQAFRDLIPAKSAVAEHFVTNGKMPATAEESGFPTINPSPYLSRITYRRINSNSALLTGTITNQIGGDTQAGQTIVVKAVGFRDPVILVDYLCAAGTVATKHLPESCRRAISGSTDGQGGTPDTNNQPMANNGRKPQPIISGPDIQALPQPPVNLLQVSKCLLYKCGGDPWKVKNELPVFSAPDSASTRIGTVASGVVFEPTNAAWITIKPSIDKVRERFSLPGNAAYWFEPGELIYSYAYWGHGCVTAWTMGYLYGYSKEKDYRIRADVTCLELLVPDTYFDTIQKGEYVIWFELRLDDGRIGWLMKEVNGDESNLEICFSCALTVRGKEGEPVQGAALPISRQVTTWVVKDVSSGIKDVIGQAPQDIDLANPQVAAQLYSEGCRAGGGGYSYFGTIYVYQNGKYVAKGNLRGCDGGSGKSFYENLAAETRASERERSKYQQARESDQGIKNTRDMDSDLIKELNAQVGGIKSHPSCRDGCKEFYVFCNAPDNVSNADRANGISDMRFVGIKWLRFGGATLPGGLIISDEKKWYEEKWLMRLEKVNGSWSKEKRGGGWDENYICNPRRPR